MKHDSQWTKEAIMAGFDRFIEENGHLPTAPEVDNCEYLPSARQIQRKYGGLKELRAVLGYEETEFGSGKYRAKISNMTNIRGRDAERLVEEGLIEAFGEVYVHAEKRYGKSTNRADFVVFTPEGNFAIDVFYTETLRDFQKNINIKVDKYADFPRNVPLYFVCANPSITEENIATLTTNMSKIARIPKLKVIGLQGLYAELNGRVRYNDPTNFRPLLDT